MTVLNAELRHTLELVRLRQIPWHKNKGVFTKLEAEGLIEPVAQKTVSESAWPSPVIAVLTDRGKLALDQMPEGDEDRLAGGGD